MSSSRRGGYGAIPAGGISADKLADSLKQFQMALCLPGAMLVGGDAFGGSWSGCDQLNDLASVAFSATNVKVFAADTSIYATFSTSASAGGYPLDYMYNRAAWAQANDAVYFGGPVPFSELRTVLAAGFASYSGDASAICCKDHSRHCRRHTFT